MSTLRVRNQEIHLTHCHRKPERSFFWKGKQFPVCARCTGYHIGYISYFLFLFDVVYLNLTWTLLLMVPNMLDGLTQAFVNRESNNLLRVTTGFMAGVSVVSLISLIGLYIGNQILLLL